MLEIVLLILKIIGIIIASILGVIVLALITILFVPIRYKIHAVKEENDGFFGNVKVSYLLHLITFTFSYDGKVDSALRICGIKFKKKDKTDKEDNYAEETPEYTIDNNDDFLEEDVSEVEIIEHSNIEEETLENIEQEIEPKTSTEDKIITDSDVGDKKMSFADKLRAFEEFLIKSIGKINKFIADCSNKAEVISDKISNSLTKMSNNINMISDSRNQRAIIDILSEIKYIVRRLLPRKIRGVVEFGFDDPATTGQILMILGILAPVLPRKLTINPQFENVCFDCDVMMKGRFCIATLVVSLWRLFFNKDVRRLYRLVKSKD